MDFRLLVGIAVWRLTRMLWTEAGPLDIFLRLRAKLAAGQKRRGGLFDLISCFYCLSVWVSMLFALFISDGFLLFAFNTLILSGIASIIHEIIVIIKSKESVKREKTTL